jgi:hypothetical protein
VILQAAPVHAAQAAQAAVAILLVLGKVMSLPIVFMKELAITLIPPKDDTKSVRKIRNSLLGTSRRLMIKEESTNLSRSMKRKFLKRTNLRKKPQNFTISLSKSSKIKNGEMINLDIIVIIVDIDLMITIDITTPDTDPTIFDMKTDPRKNCVLQKHLKNPRRRRLWKNPRKWISSSKTSASTLNKTKS